MQHTATHCNTLQHIDTHLSILGVRVDTVARAVEQASTESRFVKRKEERGTYRESKKKHERASMRQQQEGGMGRLRLVGSLKL